MIVTLIEDSFENDPAAFLEWAYGKRARRQYFEQLEWNQRSGQSFMNVLRLYDEAAYIRISGSSDDPFYVDEKIPAAIDKITSK